MGKMQVRKHKLKKKQKTTGQTKPKENKTETAAVAQEAYTTAVITELKVSNFERFWGHFGKIKVALNKKKIRYEMFRK